MILAAPLAWWAFRWTAQVGIGFGSSRSLEDDLAGGFMGVAVGALISAPAVLAAGLLVGMSLGFYAEWRHGRRAVPPSLHDDHDQGDQLAEPPDPSGKA